MEEWEQNREVNKKNNLHFQDTTEMKNNKLTRNIQLHFRVNEEERNLIKKRMELTGIKSPGVYLRKMAIDGYIITLDLSDIKEVIRLLRICSNNINQYAKKANETDNIYKEDIQDIKRSQEELWLLLKEILKRLSGI